MGGGILGGWGRVGRHLTPPNQFTGVRGIWVFIRRGETDPLLAAFTCSMNKLQLHRGRNSRQQHTTLLRIQRTVWSGSVNLWFLDTLIRFNLQYCYHTQSFYFLTPKNSFRLWWSVSENVQCFDSTTGCSYIGQKTNIFLMIWRTTAQEALID